MRHLPGSGSEDGDVDEAGASAGGGSGGRRSSGGGNVAAAAAAAAGGGGGGSGGGGGGSGGGDGGGGGNSSSERRSRRKKGLKRRKTSGRDGLALTLFLLRTGNRSNVAAHLFGVSKTTASRYFTTWVCFLDRHLGDVFPYPTTDELKGATGEQLQEAFGIDPDGRWHFESIIDCHEHEMEAARDKTVARTVWSEYKQRYTLNFLGAIGPNGAFTFVTTAYPGRITDPELTRLCGFLDTIHEFSITSAEKGFMMHKDFSDALHTLSVPPKAANKQEAFSGQQMFDTARIARKRIHVERAFRRAQEFNICTGAFPSERWISGG